MLHYHPFRCRIAILLLVSDVAVLGKVLEMAQKLRKAYELHRQDVASLPDAHRMKRPDR